MYVYCLITLFCIGSVSKRSLFYRGCRGCEHMVFGFITTYAITKSMPITTNVVCSTPLRRAVLDKKLNDIVDSDLQQVSGFLLYSGFLHQ